MKKLLALLTISMLLAGCNQNNKSNKHVEGDTWEDSTYQNEINGDHVTLNEIMQTINNISENFDMTDGVIGLTNSFIDAHNPNPNIPTYEKYQRLIRLELELAKQCQWFNFLCKYKTQHSIEKVHTYVPNGAIEYNQRNFMLTKYMVEYYDKLVNHNARQL